MALGFIKKIFSFGKKEVEEAPAEVPVVEVETTETIEQTYEDTAAQETLSVAEEIQVIEVEPAAAPAPPAEPEAPALLPESEPHVVQQVEQVEIESSEPLEQPIIEAIAAPIDPETLHDEREQVVEPEPAAPEPDQPESAPVAETPPAAPVPVAPTSQEPKPLPKKVTVSKTVEEKQAEQPALPEPEKRLTWFERLRKGLSRSSQQLGDSIGGIFTRRKLDEDTLQDLEDVLIQADLGMETAIRITGALSATRYGKDISPEEVRSIMATEIEKVLGPVAKPLELDLSHKPHVILVVGVNGTGKTTTIGKLAAKLTAGGLSVMLAAGDTFRAAAIEQLHIWGKRTGAPVVSSKLGADAAGLAFDAWKQAKEAGSDVLIIDTAGRLQNRTELMDELAKIVRVLGKNDPEAPHTVLQTLDATTGQNALNQVEIFRNIAGVNGLVMTKLDGTARGGILVAISAKHKLPVYFIGVGEQVDDLEPFAASDFAKAIAGVA